MKCSPIVWLLAICVAGVFTEREARGQGPYGNPTSGNPYSRPAYSPYLNLLRGGASPATNYFGLVRPQLDFRSGLLQLQQQTATLDQGFATPLDEAVTGRGHAIA